jgi:drug/metabolite transporter (DMT)-like permease
MTDYGGGFRQDPERYTLNAGRFWASSVATAIVAALITVVGVLVARGLFDVPILTPRSHGVWGDASTVTYAAGAAVVAVLAAGLMHLLTLTVAEPRRFFGWIMALATLIAVILPLTLADRTGSRIATAVINLAIGAAVATIVDSVARATRRPPTAGPYEVEPFVPHPAGRPGPR